MKTDLFGVEWGGGGGRIAGGVCTTNHNGTLLLDFIRWSWT